MKTMFHLGFGSAVLALLAASASAQSVVINEFSQGASGNKEWIEAVVVTGPVDMRGWGFTDGTNGIATCAQLSNDSAWSAVATGTVIVVYNGADLDTGIVQDVDFTDKFVMVPHNHASLMVAGRSFQAFGNSTATDNARLLDSTGTVVHDWDQTDNAAFTAGTLRPGSAQAVSFNGDTAAGVSTSTNWARTTAATATPGAGNGGVNSTWITTLQSAPPPSNFAPSLTNRTISPTQPTSSTPLTFTVDAADTDGTVTAVTLNYRVEAAAAPSGGFTTAAMTLSSGSTYTVSPAALAAVGTGNNVFYYFSATDDDSAVTELGSAASPFRTYVNNNRAAAGELVITEFNYTGNSTSSNAEFIEILNTTGAKTIDLSYWGVKDIDPVGGSRPARFPIGTSIAPGAYLVMTGDLAGFNSQAQWVASSTGSTVIGGITFGFSSSAAESFDITNDLDAVYASVPYQGTVAPWSQANSAGRSMEIINPLGSQSDSANWRGDASKNTIGSPGAANWAYPSAPSAIGAAASINVVQGGSTTGTSVATVNDNQDAPGSLVITDNAPVGLTITYNNTNGAVTADVAASGSVGTTTYTITATVTDSATSTNTFTFDVVVASNVSEWMILND